MQSLTVFFWLLMTNQLFESSVLYELLTSKKITNVIGEPSAFMFFKGF